MSAKDILGSIEPVVDALQEAHDLWHDAEQSYHKPREFRTYLNALIQASRNVTFRAQAHKNSIPGFDDWYPTWQAFFRNDATMRWITDSRNTVVKERGLQIASRATVRVIASYDVPFQHTREIDPLTPTDAILEGFVDAVGPMPANSLVSVTRHWSTRELDGAEILSFVARAVSILERFVDDLVCLVAEPSVPPTLATNTMFAPKTVAACMTSDEFQTIHIVPTTKQHFEVSEEILESSPSSQIAAKVRYGIADLTADSARSAGDFAEWLLESSTKVLQADGHHLSLVWLQTEKGEWTVTVFDPEDRSEKYFLWHRIGERVRNSRAVAIAFVGEMWFADTSPKSIRAAASTGLQRHRGRREGLMVYVETMDGEVISWLTPFVRRFGKIRMRPPAPLHGQEATFAQPVRSVWDQRKANRT